MVLRKLAHYTEKIKFDSYLKSCTKINSIKRTKYKGGNYKTIKEHFCDTSVRKDLRSNKVWLMEAAGMGRSNIRMKDFYSMKETRDRASEYICKSKMKQIRS